MTRRRRKKDQADRQHDLAARGIQPESHIELPPGAIWADCSQQVPWGSYSSPPIYYEDIDFECVDCGAADTWTAEQQKWYYEVVKGQLYARAVRCRPCRQWLRENGARAVGSPSATLQGVRAALEEELLGLGFAILQVNHWPLEYTRGTVRLMFSLGARSSYFGRSFLCAHVVDDDSEPLLIRSLLLPYRATRRYELQFQEWGDGVRQFLRQL